MGAGGHRPSVAEAESRLPHLCIHGPARYAFTPRTPPSGPVRPRTRRADRSATSRA
ncbi:DUF3291 domain-containing protein [Streptomyces albogriseolus]|uniref:DUF3291 domain-containing protein n=1 Tax=Streptomyces albogriseolus TaxID=1887 RepID=UPI003F53F951